MNWILNFLRNRESVHTADQRDAKDEPSIIQVLRNSVIEMNRNVDSIGKRISGLQTANISLPEDVAKTITDHIDRGTNGALKKWIDESVERSRQDRKIMDEMLRRWKKDHDTQAEIIADLKKQLEAANDCGTKTMPIASQP